MSIICYDSERNLLERLYQWDVNQTISVTGINTLQSPVFHFCNQRSEVALVVVPDMVDGMLTAEIPNSLLKEPETLFVYIYYNTGDDGRRTFYRVRVPVIPRQRPQNYSDTENVNFTSAEILDAQLVTLIASMAETASANMLAEVEDIRHGYDGTTYQSAGDAVRAIGEALSQADHTHNVFSFETDTEYNSYYSNNTGSIRVGDFIIIGGNSVFLKMRNSLELLFTTNDLYRKPSEGIPFEDLDPSLQLRIAEGGGDTTGPSYIIQGGDSKVWGFTSETAFTQYKALNPNDIHNGDYVWIKETTPFTKSYHLYVIDSQATGGRTSIFDIDDTLLVTVQPGGVSGSYVADHYLPDILEAYYNGSSVALLTDYGVVLSPSKYNVDNGNNPVSVDFSGVFEYDGVYYGITYTISQYSVVASRRALNKAVIEVESTSTEGVYTIYSVNGQTSWSNLNLYIENMMFDEGAAVVLRVNGLEEYPCIRANQLDAYFGAFDPFTQVYVLFSILRSNSTCTRNEIPFSSSQGSGSGVTITDGSILKRYLASDVQTSLGRADTALQSITQQNFASAGDGFITSGSSSTTTKTATLNGFVLTNGGKIVVKFTYAVGANATLNISNGTSNTGAKAIYYNGAKITANVIGAGGIALLVYNSAQNSNAGAYEVIALNSGHKPSAGWDKTDLVSSVQTSLDKADAAVPNSFGSANSGKPIVVNSSGEASVGSWPSGGSGGSQATWNDVLPTGGIPGEDLSDDVIAAISRGQKAIVTYNALTQTVDVTPAQIHSVWHHALQSGHDGNIVVLHEYDVGDYEIPLVFVDSTKTKAVFSGIISNQSAGTIQSVVYVVSSDMSTTKTVTPVGGSGTGYTGPTITTPESSDVGKQLLAGTNGSTRWAAPEAPIRFTNTGSASSTSRTNTSVSGFELVIGKKIVVKFNNGVPANCTLNVNSTGAKNIRYNGANITANTIKAGDEVTMVYDGNYYVVTNIDHVTSLVPTEATTSNQLADKSWVNTQIANSSGSSGGGSATIETIALTITAYQNSMDLSTALNYSNLSAKVQAGARFISQMTIGNDQVNIEWTVLGNQTTQEIIGFYTVVEDANGSNLWVAYLSPTGGDEMSGEIETQLIGNAKAPKRTTKSGTSPAAFALYDNEIYTCGTVESLTITNVASGAECILIFTSGSTPTNISLPSHLVFADGSPDVVNGVFVPSANYLYEINVSNRRAVVSRWAV